MTTSGAPLGGVLPRGVRNNNPGNIDRQSGVTWEGQASDQSSDARFVVFTLPEDGIRAIAIIFENYQSEHGLHSIDEMIARWAPPTENSTHAYADFVASKLGIGVATPFDFRQFVFAVPFVNAIISMECDHYVYPAGTVEGALAMAGIVKPQVEA